MSNRSKLRLVVGIALSTALLISVMNTRLAAQGTIGSILGTVTDSSGSVIAGARVQATNTGTNAIQATTTDSQGRYTIPALPVGDYDVQGEAMGFQTVIRKGVRLSAGADVVMDMSLTVGQVTQTVVVEAEAAQVETTSSALGTTVQPQQMRELPLNGRNFEELVQLSPGVNVSRGSGTTKSSFMGKQDYWTVSGSRPSGQQILMDGTDIQQYQNRGSGTGILGTSLGVDAISEFQMLTNTYGAQYGGSGSVMNSVTRSGTNTLHGSAYIFARDNKFDAIQWPSSSNLPFTKEQYGGTVGGPIKKDKMFFFVNYEGLNQSQTQSQLDTVPNALAHQGIIPATKAPSAQCVQTNAYPVPSNAAAGSLMFDCGSSTANAANFAIIKPYLDQYPLPGVPGTALNQSQITGFKTAQSAQFANLVDQGNGTAKLTVSAKSPGREAFGLARYDWTISQKDSLFARYLIDDAYAEEPFYAAWPMWPELDTSRNQFVTVGYKRVISDNLVNSLQGGYTRTFFNIHNESIHPVTTPGVIPSGSLNFLGDMFTPFGLPIQDASLSPGSAISAIGGGISPIVKTQTRQSMSDDLFWIKSGHSIRFGGGVTSVKTDGIHVSNTAAGQWTFSNLGSFLAASPSQFNGACNYYNAEPFCTFTNGTPLPFPNDFHAGRHLEFAMYAQDDWKIRPNLTLNLGLRYAPTSTPTDATHQIYQLLPVPYGQTGIGITTPSVGVAPPTELTATNNFFFVNPGIHNFDPRIGLAWSPFKDQKTSVRAGYGIFHAILQCRDYCYGAWFGQPFTVKTVTTSAILQSWFRSPNGPNPYATAQQPGQAAATSNLFGMNPYNTTPYMQQWNLAIQREITKDTVLTVAYVGSNGIHLLGQRDSNAPLPSGSIQPYTAAGNLGAINLTNGQTLWPNFTGYSDNLVFMSGNGTFSVNNNANLGPVGARLATCTSAAGCTLANANGAPIINPATGQPSYAHLVQTGTTFSTLRNVGWNPNFSFMLTATDGLTSHYNALQVGLNRRLSRGLQLQAGYTYASCIDISSGNFGQEGGNRIINPYTLQGEAGNCGFWTRHNTSINGMYLLPFKGNRLVEGWQISSIFYGSTGGPFEVVGVTNLGNSVGASAPRPNIVLNAPGCNGQPVNTNWSTNNLIYANAACFQQQPLGEEGNLHRNFNIGPNIVNLNVSMQKSTKLTERYELQIRIEAFNVLNRRNFDQPLATSTFTQGSNTSASTVLTATPVANFGQLTSIGTPMRQMQFGAKLTF